MKGGQSDWVNDGYGIPAKFCCGCIYDMHCGLPGHVYCNAYYATGGRLRPEADETGRCKNYTPKGGKVK